MEKPKNISQKPGVYIFKNRAEKPLYAGNAGNMKKRLAFYFSKTAKSPKITKLLEEAKKIQIIETDSEIEALIKETELIKKHLPKYNVLMRDDKNYFYVGVTHEQFPRIFLTHQPYNENSKFGYRNSKQITNLKIQKIKHQKRVSDFGVESKGFCFRRASNFIEYVGPFTDGNALKSTLRLLRRIFPYCTCKEFHKRPCLNAEIGRCLGFCCYDNKSNFQFLRQRRIRLWRTISNFQTNSKFQIKKYKQLLEYSSNIKNIIAILNGKKIKLLQQLKKQMVTEAKNQSYEKAAVLRDQIQGLKNIFAHRLILKSRSPAGGRGF